MNSTRDNSWLRYAAPVFACLFLLTFYWRALNCWFYQDDFGWLHLGLGPHPMPFSFELLFSPKAHGTIRPWTSNLLFCGLGRRFAFTPPPFHPFTFSPLIP